MKPSPIVLFVYNRPEHTRKTVAALKRNKLACKSDLYIYADGVRNEAAKAGVREVRDYIKTVSGFGSVTILERRRNWGLANSIIDGVSRIVNKHGTVIVLEDDLVTSPFFLTYMNESLKRYAKDERVASIHGYIYPVDAPLPETFFLRGADCWGWATWKRAWALFEPDGVLLLNELKRRKLQKAFNCNGAYSYVQMLKNQINGKNDSWAVRWHASAFLADKLTLYPGHSLVHNIGLDNSGEHCGEGTFLDVALSKSPIRVNTIATEPSTVGGKAVATFLRRHTGFGPSMVNKVRSKIRRTFR